MRQSDALNAIYTDICPHIHGHLSHHCPNRAVRVGQRWFNCEGLGHIGEDCPEPLHFQVRRQGDLGSGLRRQFFFSLKHLLFGVIHFYIYSCHRFSKIHEELAKWKHSSSDNNWGFLATFFWNWCSIQSLIIILLNFLKFFCFLSVLGPVIWAIWHTLKLFYH